MANKKTVKYNKNSTKQQEKENEEVATNNNGMIYTAIIFFVGMFLAINLGYQYSVYAKLLHENDMWFSNIKQVEREISFRTESGLYYSYYKQMVLAPTISQGLYDLTHDNRTEHLKTINILERFNIYQEVFLGVLYKILPQQWRDSKEYVYFYLDTIFGLHGMYMVALYVAAWLMSGSFVAGILTVAFFVFNRLDMTRLSFTMPLRESFSLPFIYVQLAAATFYFRKDVSPWKQKLSLFIITISTFCLTITWQFAQFVLLLESFAFFAMFALEFSCASKVKPFFMIIIANLSTVCVLQFGNDMLYTSLVGSFCIAAIIVLSYKVNAGKEGGFVKKLFVLVVRIAVVLGLAFLINFLIKKATKVDSDEHVFKFVSAKLGYGDALKKDFDARLYLCEGGFQYLPLNTFARLTDGIVFPVYVASGIGLLLVLVFSFFQKLRGSTSVLDDYPELVFHLILDIFFGAMAMTTLRMKFLWMPHMCVLAASVISHQDMWKSCLSSIHFKGFLNFAVRHSVPVIILSMLLFKKLDLTLENMKQLREFHDPDTVELMEWIKSSTPRESAFTGSMQLMAGVKLCTDRPITNHPHYENKFLRERTKEVYQIYARGEPSEIHKILRKHGTNYIILENSICFSRMEHGCRLKDILDLDNGHELDGKGKGPPRFCEAIKNAQDKRYTKYFKKVFENRTFYLYQLIT